MENFYTIIKITPNSVAGDNLSIGLLVRDSERFWIHFSDEKKSLAKRLLGEKGDTIDFIARQIEQKIFEVNGELDKQKGQLFKLDDLLTSDRFVHLNAYSKGIVGFTQPAFLNDTISEEKFEKLFKLLIDKTYMKSKTEPDEKDNIFRSTIQNKLVNRVQNRVHTNLDLTPEKVPGLYYTINVDCIGKNGNLISAKAIPFHKKYDTIDRELSHYFGAMSILKKIYTPDKTTDKLYIIGDEPTDINSKEHKTWENIKSNPTVTLLFSEQSNAIAEEIEEKDAKEFLAL